jgi:hypothetical protein
MKYPRTPDSKLDAPFAAMLRDAGLPWPECEYRFCDRAWRFDLAWPRWKVAIEIEGGVFGRGKPCPACGRRRTGAHSSVGGLLRDIEKYNAAAALGWRVIRIVPEKLRTFATVELLLDALVAAGWAEQEAA